MYDRKFHHSPLDKYSFLITGGAGFIGSNLVEYLLKYGAGKVRVLDNFSNGFNKNISQFLQSDSFELIEGDIRDLHTCQRAAEGMDYVLHQAALGSVPRSIKDPLTTNAVNIDGFLNMLVASRDQRVKRIIYAASSSTYGDSTTLPKVEEVIGNPLSPYAVTKYVNELYADIFNSVYQTNAIGLRYFNVFGPKQDPKGAYAAVIPLFINSILEGKSPIIFGDGEQTRDFTFVENAVEANIRALFSEDIPDKSKVFNVACGEKISLNQLFYFLKEITGSDIDPTYTAPRAGDIRDSLADLTKSRKFLAYNPGVSVRDGLQITLNWFKNNKEFIEQRN